jgi:hypothetical protein
MPMRHDLYKIAEPSTWKIYWLCGTTSRILAKIISVLIQKQQPPANKEDGSGSNNQVDDTALV